MVERFKMVLKEIRHGENLDLYVTILLAIVVGVLGIVGVAKFEVLSAAILATLGVLAGSLLSSRRSTDTVTKRLTVLDNIRSEIKKLSESRVSLRELFDVRALLPPLEEKIADAKSIDICGMSLLSISTEHRELLLKKVKSGCRIRLLLLNPRNENLMQMAAPFAGTLSEKIHTQAIMTSLGSLASDPVFSGSSLVQVHICDYPLAHGLFIVNGNTPEGEMRVEMYAYKKVPRNTPGFSIRKDQVPHWFEFFWTEFEELWRSAREYELDSNDQRSAEQAALSS